MKRTALVLVLVMLLPVMLLSSCQQKQMGLYDGYYTAEAKEFDAYGWKEFITIYVSNGRVVTVEYNAKNAVGFIKSWDMEYMREMDRADGTYPNKYTREYAQRLLVHFNASYEAVLEDTASLDDIDSIAGATHSYHSFLALAKEVVDQAKRGDHSVSLIDLSEITD